MANVTLSLGSVVVNFGTTAQVVGFFAAASGEVVAETGWPILRQVGHNGRLRGGKWVADPAKCTPAPAAAGSRVELDGGNAVAWTDAAGVTRVDW